MSKADPMVVGEKKHHYLKKLLENYFTLWSFWNQDWVGANPKCLGVYPTWLSNPHMSIDLHFKPRNCLISQKWLFKSFKWMWMIWAKPNSHVYFGHF
jgi:hypothetical protein